MGVKNNFMQLLDLAKNKCNVDFKVIVVTMKSQLVALCNEIKQSKLVSIALQGTDIDPMKSACAGISIAYDNKSVYFIPRHNNEDINALSWFDVTLHLKNVFADHAIEKIMYDAAFNQIVLHQNGMPIAGKIFDTYIAVHVIQQCMQPDTFFDVHDYYTQHAIQSKIKQEKLDIVAMAIEPSLWSMITQTHCSLNLHKILYAMLEKENLIKQFNSIEMPLQSILIVMQMTGVVWDIKIVKKLDMQVCQELESLLYTVNSYSSIPVDLHIFAQVKTLLFETLALPGKRKMQALEKLDPDATMQEILSKTFVDVSKRHLVVSAIVRYQELFYYKEHILNELLRYVNPITFRIHAFWQQKFDVINPIVCNNPDLQKITHQDFVYKMTVRNACIAQEGYSFVAINYKFVQNIKLWIVKLAQYLQDNNIDGTIVLILQHQIVAQVKDSCLHELCQLLPQFIDDFFTTIDAAQFVIKTGKNWSDVTV